MLTNYMQQLRQIYTGTITCDKCEGRVPLENSCLALMDVLSGRFSGYTRDRHIYPVDDCSGSPSRAEKIATDPAWRNAYQKLQEAHHATTDLG